MTIRSSRRAAPACRSGTSPGQLDDLVLRPARRVAEGPDRKLETGPSRVLAKSSGRDRAITEPGRTTKGNTTSGEGGYPRRVGLSSGIRRAPERARDGTGQTGPLAPATQASDQGRGGRPRTVRKPTHGGGHPAGRWSGRGALGGSALRRGGPNGRGFVVSVSTELDEVSAERICRTIAVKYEGTLRLWWL